MKRGIRRQRTRGRTIGSITVVACYKEDVRVGGGGRQGRGASDNYLVVEESGDVAFDLHGEEYSNCNAEGGYYDSNGDP